jgi:hypothetical protein
MSSTVASQPGREPAAPDDSAFRLHTPMFLKPAEGSVRAVSSPTPLMLNGVKVWSSAPIHIYDAGGSRTIQVEPLDALGAEFVRGWHKLPDD